ncbi:MAG: phenylalanine--tRNA ligase subunit alpha [bacterium]|nr:phenylalanine--tRNA ligase subunit alpha [bacterium]
MMQMMDLETKIAQLLAQAQADQSADWETKYLGKKGLFRQLAAQIREVEDKKLAGEKFNQLKLQLEEILSSKVNDQKADAARVQTSSPDKTVDLTLPADDKEPAGHLHPITQAIEEISDIFARLGFIRVRHPELDLDENVFERLNMAPNHPARDEWETFFVSHPGEASGKLPTWVMTPHTSNGQVHEMKRLGQPPVRMINIGRCYRRQQDATHTQMFHQFEGLLIDKGINITHLKGVLDYFAREFYGVGTKSRIRPFHFQFTEPSFEIDFSCQICGGTGEVDGQKCKFCKSGWHEVGGAGMVHPNVLRAAGIDPEIYTGFAFGWGIERTYTLRPGLNIDDIRNFYNGNLDFLQQF